MSKTIDERDIQPFGCDTQSESNGEDGHRFARNARNAVLAIVVSLAVLHAAKEILASARTSVTVRSIRRTRMVFVKEFPD